MNKLKITIFVLTIVLSGLFLFAGSALQTDAPGVRLRAAIEKEEVEGDLQAAIEQYKKIVADNGDNRVIAARALLRLGGCYEKLGREEAQKTYRQLIHDFPDQVDAVQVAKEKLTLLEKGSSNMSLRLVWEGPEVDITGETSPDGRYICYTDWDTGDIAIHNLTTGENRRLSGQTENDGSWADSSRWSPDGRFVAYTWITQGDTADLRIVAVDKGEPRILFPYKDFKWLSVEDWSPDGRQILVKLYNEISMRNDGSVSLVSVADGSVQHLKKMDRMVTVEGGYMEFSPDGRYIAYDLRNESPSGGITSSADKDIYLLSVDGEIQIPLVKNPANDRLLGWTPAGRNILFASNRTGAVDAWMLPVKDGKPSGEARIVRKGIGAVSPLGFTRDGSYLYGSGKDMLNIYIATLNGKSDSKTATYKKLELPLEGHNDLPTFSPDGKRLAFIRGSRSGGICIHDLETGEEKTFPLNLQPISLGWAPDGSSILIDALSEQRSFVVTIDTLTGETKPVFPTDKDVREERYAMPSWSPDGRTVYWVRVTWMMDGNPQWAIIAKDIGTGQIKTVYEESLRLPIRTPMISVSPDGAWLAAFSIPMGGNNGGATEWLLRIISTMDGKAHDLFRFVNATNQSLFALWSTDGRYIFFPGIRPGEETWDVWYVPVEGGEPKGLGLNQTRITYISFHPDGKRFAFSSHGPTVHGPEVWMMENFLTQ
jgi:Tol biopolymer transport system component